MEMATETARPASDAGTDLLTTADRVALLRFMLLMRSVESRAMTLYRQGKVPGSFYDGFGQEAVSVGAAFALAAEDRLCILHRDLGAHLVRGVAPARILGQYMGRAGGITAGREGNVHFGDPALGCVGMVSMLPDMMLVATGMGMAFKLRHEARCAITWFGDGSTSRGDFHEALNWAAVQKLPVIFVLENNQYAYSTPTDRQFAVNPGRRAASYGMHGESVDGNDVEAMFDAVQPRPRTRDRRRRPDAAGGGDDAHARPCRPRRHALRAGRAGRGLGQARSDRPPGRPSSRARRRRGRAARAGRGRGRRRRHRGAGDADARSGDGDRRRVRRRGGPLGDGLAPWSGWAEAAR